MPLKTRKFSVRAVSLVFWQHTKRYWVVALAAFIFMTGYGVIDVIIPIYYKQILDVLAANIHNPRATLPTLLTILYIILAYNLLAWSSRRLGQFAILYADSKIMADLIRTAFDKMLQHSYGFFTNNFAGSLVRKVTRLSRSFEDVSDQIMFNILPVIVSLVGIVIVLFSRSVVLGEIYLAWALVFIVFQLFLARYKMKFNLASAEKDSEVTGKLSDTLSNETAVKLFGGSAFERKQFWNVTEELHILRFRAWSFDEYINMGQALLTIVLEFGLVYAGIQLWLRGKITIGDFALIQSYLVASFIQLWNFGNSVRRVFSAYADATEIVDIMNMPLEIKDSPGATILEISRGAIDFRDVDFTFNETRKVLEKFNLSIAPQEKIALVGPSGAGKTTITKLLLRLYDVSGGGIYIDDQNIAQVTQESLRHAVSLVPQEPVLFHRTLMENIRYGRQEATDEEVVEAAKNAHCYEFISRYPEGFNTYVGERGVKLSGGERQRVAIARAVLKNAPILILDEATSSLDSESEMLIQDALARLMQGKTVIAIAHRLSTIMKMDRIIVMEDGKAILSGTHDELVAQESNLYKKLWEIQAGGFIGGNDEEPGESGNTEEEDD